MTTSKTTNHLLWVKIPAEYAKKLSETADRLGISRADLMRLLLINSLDAESGSLTLVINAKK